MVLKGTCDQFDFNPDYDGPILCPTCRKNGTITVVWVDRTGAPPKRCAVPVIAEDVPCPACGMTDAKLEANPAEGSFPVCMVCGRADVQECVRRIREISTTAKDKETMTEEKDDALQQLQLEAVVNETALDTYIQGIVARSGKHRRIQKTEKAQRLARVEEITQAEGGKERALVELSLIHI